jgi:U3 small nucleolar RNA-associated protein 14
MSMMQFQPETALEIDIAKILHGAEYVERKQAEIHGKPKTSSEAETYVRNIEEALEKHNELSRLRALQSYEMAKAKRQNKIKSKKYHRLLRREKIRKQLKEFEELQEKDPEAAMLKLEELDKARVQERMSLKHRNTSKWAKMQSARAKYNKDSRIALSEQLKISRDLTVKLAVSSIQNSKIKMSQSIISGLVCYTFVNNYTKTKKSLNNVLKYFL